MVSDERGEAESWAKKFYREQIALLQANQIDELIERHYHSDAALISFQEIARGHDSLKNYFKRSMQALGKLEVTSIDDFSETADALFFELTVHTRLGDSIVDEAFVVREGKVTHHFITFR
jgi:hypothetical protein